jgi:hypothetical protein
VAREHSRHQQRIIRDFYRHRGAIDTQRLQEIVTDIHLATTPAKRARLWERAAAILERVEGLDAKEVARVVAERDLEALAKIATEMF